MSASVVGGLAGGDAAALVALSAALAVASELVYLAIGIARMGWIADFMSRPVWSFDAMTDDRSATRFAGLRRWWAAVRPAPRTMRPAATAGVTGAIGGVPDGMAAATLVGVNPIHGLFATAVGRIAGGLTASSQLMVVTTTSAAALAAGSALSGVPSDDRLPALFLLTLLSGAAMVVAGVLGLGRLTGFVSHSVMIGFLIGVALDIAFDQIPKLAGVDATAPSAIGRALEVVLNPGRVQVGSIAVAAVAAAVVIGLGRTRYARVAALVALVVTAAGVWITGAADVALVRDVGDIPRGLPPRRCPSCGCCRSTCSPGPPRSR